MIVIQYHQEMDWQYSWLPHKWLSSSYAIGTPAVTKAHHQGPQFKENADGILYGGQDTNQKSGLLTISPLLLHVQSQTN